MDGFGGGSVIRKLSVVSPSLAYATAGDTSGSYLDRYGSGDFTSSFASLQASQTPGQMGQPNTFHGQLDFSEHASPLGATIHLTRTNPDQSQTPLPDADIPTSAAASASRTRRRPAAATPTPPATTAIRTELARKRRRRSTSRASPPRSS